MNVIITGDFVPYQRVASQIKNNDFSCLEEVKSLIHSVDYAIVNFECPVLKKEAKPISKTGPNLHCTENAMECIARTGFNCVTLANNHFRDFGQIGVLNTLESCRKYGVDYVGGGKNLAEALQVLYKRINGQELAIINVCEHEWSIASENQGGSNPMDLVGISRQIKEAHYYADYVLLIVHGGTELYNLPTPRMKKTYRFFVEQGADAVINHHQHCYSGYEIYCGKPIFYGLGNFCFDKPHTKNDKLWKEGIMVEIQFNQEISFVLHPYVQCDGSKPAVIILKDKTAFNDALSRLNTIIADDTQLKKCYQGMVSDKRTLTKDILSPYSSFFFEKLSEKGLVPSFITKKRIRKLLANIQCESHLDILLASLTKQLEQ